MKQNLLPLNLQFFADDAGASTQASVQGQVQQSATQTGQQVVPTQAVQQVQIDYDKLSQIVEGKQAATEESVLKGYFKNQGLTKEEVEQAINAFKEQRAASQPNVNELLKQAETAKAEALKERIRSETAMMSEDFGIELKNVIPVLKLANLSNVADADGNVDKEKLKAAVSKVLEEIPIFKTIGSDNKKPQFVRGTGGTYRPEQTTDEKAYLDQKYKNNPYYKGIKGGN